MIGRTHPQPATHSLLQRLLEARSEPGFSIRHYATRHSMKSHYLPDVELGQLGHRYSKIHRQEVSTLCQSIHHHPYSIMSSHGARQVGNKIHSYAIPLPHRNIQGLERSTEFLMLHLRLWQVKQADTNCATSFFMPCHQKLFLRSWYILVMPGCRLKQLLCHSSRTNLLNSASSSTQTLPLNLNTPSLPKANSLAWSDPSSSFTFCRLASPACFSLIKPKKSLDTVKVLHLMNSGSNSTWSFMSLKLSSNSNSLIIKCATCIVFLLNASATTFTFPGW